ncbi:MAG: hypothetical protein K2W95_32255 [Candidatus Obscuribacterales bacterium]|nr:hypothetical protein [Candidatus Obscuribacterales bacterium]
MTPLLFIAGVSAGVLGALVSAMVVAKKFALKLDEGNEPVGTALGACVAAGGAAGAGLVDRLAGSGVLAQLLAILSIAPVFVCAVVLVLNVVPRVRNSVGRLTDWLVTLTVVRSSKEQALQKRIEELEEIVRKIRGQETQS